MSTAPARSRTLTYAALALFFAALAAAWIFESTPAFFVLWTPGAVCAFYAIRLGRRRA